MPWQVFITSSENAVQSGFWSLPIRAREKKGICELSKGKTIPGLRSSIFEAQYFVGRFRCLKLTTIT